MAAGNRKHRRVLGVASFSCVAALLFIAGAPASVWGEPEGQPAAPAASPNELPSLDQIQALMGRMGGGGAQADESGLRPFAEVSKGYEKVVTTAEGDGYYVLYKRERDQGLLAELPRGYESHKQFFAMTVASGEEYAGLQGGDLYCYWKRMDNRLLLIQPQIDTRSTGDAESKSSVKRLFTDRVVLDVPIVAMGPSGQPVIDVKDLLISRGSTFFGSSAMGANARLASVKTAKSFPSNTEISFEVPTQGGVLRTLHYSISKIPDNTGYKPRVADERVGYFTTVYRDLGKMNNQDKWVRYVNRWKLEKRDPSLRLSPPKEPIVFYIESAVPVRYRRWVEQGALSWNKAFEKVGILNAIQVHQQDAETGAHMDKDPEDVRYNFIRWLSNDIGTAIGPSRVHPLTGEILDADVILTDGWIRHFWYNYNEILPEIAMEGMAPETLAWLEKRPQWDPRLRLLPVEERNMAMLARARTGIQAYGGHPIAAAAHDCTGHLMGDHEFDGLINRRSQVNGMCMASRGKGFDLATMRIVMEMMTQEREVEQLALETLSSAVTKAEAGAALDEDEEELKKLLDSLPPEIRAMVEQQIKAMGGIEAIKAMIPKDMLDKMKAKVEAKAVAEPAKDEAKSDEKPKEEKKDKPKKDYDELDGVPDWFIGPLLADLTSHEVGHTIGLRHNFKGSSVFTLAEINSPEVKGKQNWSASVMDYNPINVNMQDGPIQGDFAQLGSIGAYDYWAIEYGYTMEDTKEVLKKVNDPKHAYATDEDTGGPDPLARRYDLSKNPLDFAKSQVRLAKYQRDRLLTKFVKDGESWAKARRGYEMSLGLQTRALSMMANWVGGSFVSRARKGDVEGVSPITPVGATDQRDALKFCVENAFRDEAFGLNPELLSKMTTDKWLDWGGWREAFQESAFPVHDRVAGIQAAVLTMIMNPTTLRRVYDNEFRVASESDTVTLPEVIDTVTTEIFAELNQTPSKKYSAREPMISSLRRNLQSELVDRLIDLTLPASQSGEASKPISNLAAAKLREIHGKMKSVGENHASKLDPYTSAYLGEMQTRIQRALDAQYVYNIPNFSFDFPMWMLFGQEGKQQPASSSEGFPARR
ncbi:MAG: zinc-dependent metalloprotease [Planctomycetota bacterium]|nr:zinc-dependent metalloprotease [Planctomycetota bacterium]